MPWIQLRVSCRESPPGRNLKPGCALWSVWTGLLQGLKPLSISVTQDPATKGLYVADVWITRDVQLYVTLLPRLPRASPTVQRGGVRL